MSLEACAELVRTADPDRYDVTIMAPEDVQRILWPLYAFNVEVSRAPWVTQEAMIAEIRLQWWRDALEEIREGRPVRSHDVTEPLAVILDAEGAMSLDKLVDARKWDIYTEPFKNKVDFDAYIDATYGNLMWTAARLIAPQVEEKLVRQFAYSCGVAAMLRATAILKVMKRKPLPDDTVAGFLDLAMRGRSDMQMVGRLHRSLPSSLTPLLMSGWQANPTFRAIRTHPQEVYENGFTQSEFARRCRLLKLSVLGWRF